VPGKGEGLAAEGLRNELSHRERWLRCFHFQPIDRIPNVEFGYWTDTFKRWHAEGLPEEIDSNAKADRYFGFDPSVGMPVNLGLIPRFTPKVLHEDERRKVIVDATGVKCEVRADGSSSIPHYLEFPVKSREDWEEFKKRLNPKSEGRFPPAERWERVKAELNQADVPRHISCGSLFGWPRNWMGFERATTLFYDDPQLMAEIMDTIVDLVTTVIAPALREVQFDQGNFWEDMAFRNGPMISPRLFEEFMVPRYQRITSLLREHGVDLVCVDCDGNINELVPLWLEAGVNMMFPIEVAAGTDPIELREKFGRRVLLKGGVNKRALAEGREAIKKELRRLVPLVEDGGFVPHVDHRVPPDVSFADYLYYLEAKKDIFGMT